MDMAIITKDQLELVVQKKKGPAGCGKTTTLRWVGRELKIPIKDYSDTTDTTAISYEINQSKSNEDDRSFDRRKASRFEHFVFNHLRFNSLFLSTGDSQSPDLARADSEFDDSDDDPPTQVTQPKQPDISGIIIHVESPLMFAKSQKIFMSSMVKMVKMIRELSRSSPRRVAIVFETLESNKDILSLPTKFKTAIGMQIIKFNPIIRANMRKFIEFMLRKYQNVSIDKDTMDTLITDCDGDLQACINTMEMIRNKSDNYNNIYMGLDNDDDDRSPSIKPFQVSKRQKLNSDRFKLNTSLMRDVTRSLGFFHNLGKIFYQKRLYPDLSNGAMTKIRHRTVDRPYLTENDTEYLVSQLDAEPKKLMPWLHQHYHKFCNVQNIEKAALFLEHLSDIDTISMNSTQSSQFYEMHGPLDHIQMYLAVSATIFSLYEDQSKVVKSSHKKISNGQGSHIIKTSVESSVTSELFSFSKPASLSLARVVEDHQAILTQCSDELMKYNIGSVDSSTILTDYLPYLSAMSDSWSEQAGTRSQLINGLAESRPQICNDWKLMKKVNILKTFAEDPKLDYDAQHESLLEYLECDSNETVNI